MLLHGGGQNAHTWDGVALALRRPLVAIDLPGHGRSSHRPDRDYWPWRNAGVVAGTIRQLADQPVVVVGMSLGGLTALRLAAGDPELVRSLVVVDVTPSVHEVNMTDAQRGTSVLVSADPSFDSFAELVEATAAASSRPREAVAARCPPQLLPPDPTGAGRGGTTGSGRPTIRRSTSARCGPTSMPSPARRCWCAAATRSTCRTPTPASSSGGGPGARLEVVPGARHAVQSDKPVELAALIEDFAFGPGSQS